MKRLFAHLGAPILLALMTGAAFAQWQVPAHNLPAGRGPGVVGFSAIAPGTAGQVLTSRGASADPVFAAGSPVIPAAAAGIVCDGTDQTAHLTTALTTYASTGVVLQFDACTYTFNAAGGIVFPNDGGSPVPKQAPVVFRGVGPIWSGEGSPKQAGTIFDMRATSALGNLQTYGLGYFEASNITFADLGTSNSNPFIYTTNTTINIHDNAFLGSHTSSGWDQDAMVLGGTTTANNGTTTAAFQGYGTVIARNSGYGIRRMVYGRVFVNGVIVRDNYTSFNSGGNAAYEFDGSTGGGNVQNIIDSPVIEMGNYVYGIKCTQCYNTMFLNIGGYDGTPGTTLASINLVSGNHNTVIGGAEPPTGRFLIDNGGATNAILNSTTEQNYLPDLGIGTNVLDFNFQVGNKTGQWIAEVAGGNTNTADGAALYIRNGSPGNVVGAFGNISSIAGGAYDASMYVYSTGNTYLGAAGAARVLLNSSGVTILNGGNITTPSVVFSGSSSGSTTLQASAVAGGALTLPNATDTLVGKATTDILSNKSFSTNVNIGSGTADALLTANANTVSSPTPPTNTVVHAVGADGSASRYTLDAFGGVPQFTARRADGTAASPTALANNDVFYQMSGFGASGAGTYFSTARGTIQMVATEAWTPSAAGSRIRMQTTKATTAVISTTFDVDGVGHTIEGIQTAPAASSCGTSPTVDSTSTDEHGLVTEGTTATGCTITFVNAHTNTPQCTVTAQTQQAAFGYTLSTTAITITNTSGSGLKVNWRCNGQ